MQDVTYPEIEDLKRNRDVVSELAQSCGLPADRDIEHEPFDATVGGERLHFMLVRGTKRGFYFNTGDWSKVITRPRAYEYYMLRVTADTGRDVGLSHVLAAPDNPLTGFFRCLAGCRQ